MTTVTGSSVMPRRRFGRTGLEMPVFSTGGMRYQDGWKDKPLSEVDPKVQANLEATIARSLEVGINHIETARGYGVSERQLGTVLPKYPREELIVQTKAGPTDDVDEFVRNFHDSLDRLQLEYVDLFSLHGLNDAEPLEKAIRPGGCLAAARELQKQGLCRHVGFSTHAPLDVLMRAVTHEGDGGFDYVNLHWYYIFQRNWPAVRAARERDMGVFIISPSDKGGKLYDPPPELVELCDPLHPIVFNDLFCLMHEQVHTLSLGAARPSDYDLHVEAASLLDRAEELVPPIVERLEQAMIEATGHASPEAGVWELPDHREAPAGLNLPVMLWLRNLLAGWGMEGYAKMRFNMLNGAGHWFPGADPAELAKVDPAELRGLAEGTLLGELAVERLHDSVTRLSGEKVKRLSQS
ncbi:MAG: aldo/keto reductase [Planctomycetota bacterium]